MPFVSDDPTWWPTISLYRRLSYLQAASLIVVVYDWALTFGQEVGPRDYRSSGYLTKNGSIVRTGLGEQSCVYRIVK
ncbi:hypothetical protein AZE42_11722 [Rhizopogon vesiculosus]|uniref:DUF6533 domain-containing protein n=1 Tax=Rhizopogon vesiculosus TaxID=180088 RepID=A0A1J8PMI5_9AGAM|nr:hypothetical protein AZE42_11722 [Rhizopogon vesiculosus]